MLSTWEEKKSMEKKEKDQTYDFFDFFGGKWVLQEMQFLLWYTITIGIASIILVLWV